MVGKQLTPGLSLLCCAVARHKRKSLTVFLLAGVAVGAVAIFAPKSYHSEGMLLIRPAKEPGVLPAGAAGQSPAASVSLARGSELNSVVEILKSRAIAAKVVDLLGPDFIFGHFTAASGAAGPASRVEPIARLFRQAWVRSQELLRHLEGTADPSDHDCAIAQLRSRYTASAAPGSDLVRIECNGPSPQWSQKTVAALMEVCQSEHLRLYGPQRMSNISVALPATYELEAASPQNTTLLAIGVACGLAAAAAVACWAEARDHSLREPEDVERHLGLPVLGAIPRLVG
jgi:uncharacterized protein involved in exopolysaccharide biosynthesis